MWPAVGGEPPNRRSVSSTQAMTVGIVRSQVGMTTRNLDQASQAHHSSVPRPSIVGPSAQSHWNHIPGSGIHGRKTRRWPARYERLTAATTRRVVRSEPAKPSARNLSWATSARTRPWLRSTHSSTLGRYRSMSWSRRAYRPGSSRPASRRRTYRATVIAEQPARRAASRRLPVRSNASRISTTSPACFTSSLLGSRGCHSTLSEPGGTVSSRRPQRRAASLSRFRGRQRSVLAAASVQVRVRLRPDSHVRRHSRGRLLGTASTGSPEPHRPDGLPCRRARGGRRAPEPRRRD